MAEARLEELANEQEKKLKALKKLQREQEREHGLNPTKVDSDVLAKLEFQYIDYRNDERLEEEIVKMGGYYKSHPERTRSKQAFRTNTYRLIQKAEANIAAVERGEFGVGHAVNKNKKN